MSGNPQPVPRPRKVPASSREGASADIEKSVKALSISDSQNAEIQRYKFLRWLLSVLYSTSQITIGWPLY